MAIMSRLSDCLGQDSCQDKPLSLLQSLLIAAHKIRAFHLESASVPGFNSGNTSDRQCLEKAKRMINN